MENLPQSVTHPTSALMRAGMYLLVPVVGLLLLPVLLLFIVVLCLLAIFHGGRIFVYSFTGTQAPSEEELQKPHFIEVHVHEKIPDERR